MLGDGIASDRRFSASLGQFDKLSLQKTKSITLIQHCKQLNINVVEAAGVEPCPKMLLQRLAKVAISPRPSDFVSAVAKVRPSTLAVAAKKRSARSSWGREICRDASAISCVS